MTRKSSIKPLLVLKLMVLLFMFGDFATAQYFEYPKYRAKNAQDVEVSSVQITDEHTIVRLNVSNLTGKSLFFSPKTYIRNSNGGDSLFVEKVDGYLFGKIYAKFKPTEKIFAFYFPRIESDGKAINFHAGEDGNFWHFFEIILNSGVGENRTVKSGEKGVSGNCRYVVNPGYTAKTDGFQIAKIEMCDTATILHFRVNIPSNRWVFVPARSSIRDSRGGNDLLVKHAEGTNINTKLYAKDSNNGTIYYKLFFPPIEKSVRKIDFREVNTGGNWFAYELDVDVDVDE